MDEIFIDQVRRTANIVDVLSDFLPLKRNGRDWKCNCPFHDEKTGSVMVSEGKQIYKCFGCGEGGDIFNFIQKYCKTTFPESVTYLAAKYGIAENDTNFQTPVFKREKPKEKPIEYINPSVLFGTIQADKHNNTFIKFICKRFSDRKERVRQTINAYQIGTFRETMVTFPQIERLGGIRYIKCMSYAENGHRDKNAFPSIIKHPQTPEGYKQAFFGEHLLRDHNGKVAVVESEKTAIIMTLIDTENKYLWIATGGGNNLRQNLAALANMEIVLFPDSEKYDSWKETALNAQKDGLRFQTIEIDDTLKNLFESNPDQYKNVDLADVALGEIDGNIEEILINK